ncbi:MAG TPA: hypothetical protein EYH02_03600, partial [Ignisphaera aggregans]|nr:hypothetical protein [Ignisphaera aggregans]
MVPIEIEEISEEELAELERELEALEKLEKEKKTERKIEQPSSAERVAATRVSTRSKGAVARISTGIPELDRALEGGIPKGSWVAITGEPGTGKSIMCIHFAWAGLQAGDHVVYVTTEAEFRDVVRQAKQFGMDFE